MIEYAVKAETRDGQIIELKRGFKSIDAAEDHRVVMKPYVMVWVEIVSDAKRAAR